MFQPVVLALVLLAAQSPGRDPLPAFQAFLRHVREGREQIDGKSIPNVRLAVGDLRIAWAVDPARGHDVAYAMLDLLALCLEHGDKEPEASPITEARDLAVNTLKAHSDPEFMRWLTRDVLSLPLSQPVERRVAVLWTLAGQRDPQILLPLLGCAREPDPRIRRAALEALVGWEDQAVNAVFLDELSRAIENEKGKSGAVAWLAEKHLHAVQIAPGSRLLPRLEWLVRRGMAALDWREASRAITLSRPLSNEAAIPGLIEALTAWKARAGKGAQALRVEMEILHALEDRSGRKLGLEPESWMSWWSAVRRGDVKGVTPQTVNPFPDSTRPSFFGLRPTTDRVTFVIDRSGSMSTPFVKPAEPARPGPKGGKGGKGGEGGEGGPGPPRSRWEEAVNQLLAFVEALGPKARFDIVIFHDYAEMWRPSLVATTPDEKRNARQWLTETRPNGGTELRAGIDRALYLQPNGRADLTRLEADTVIVLCDGATAEGPGWVEAFLERANLEARVVFHCVQIGAVGDGTLEKLARGSGGDFLHVDG